MGMFDDIKLLEPVPCPDCGEPLMDFQSKDGDCCMSTITPHDLRFAEIRRFYTSCGKCGRWVEYRRKPSPPFADWRDDFELETERIV